MTSGSILLALAVLALLAAVGVALWTHLRTRRMLDTLDRMLDDAIRGEFRESLYDESRLSALETRMAHYLSASAVSAKHLAEEKEKIKTLIGDISHQTKTPLANILLYGELLEEKASDVEERRLARQILGQAKKLEFLIQALVKMSRLESGILEIQPVKQSLKPLLEGVAETFGPGAGEKDMTLECVLPPEEVLCRYDRKWTAEALGNVVDNAIKYSPAGSRVRIRVREFEFYV